MIGSREVVSVAITDSLRGRDCTVVEVIRIAGIMPSEVGRGRVHDASQRPADRLAMISNLAISALQEVSAKCGGRLVSPAKSPPPAWGGERRVRLGRLHRALAFLRCVQDWVSNALELLAEYREDVFRAAPVGLKRLQSLVAQLIVLACCCSEECMFGERPLFSYGASSGCA